MKRSRIAHILCLASTSFLSFSVDAANYTWKGSGTTSSPGGGSWNVGTNWDGGAPASGTSSNLIFGGSGSGTYTSNNNTNNKVGTITLNSSSSGTPILAGNALDDNTGGGEDIFIVQNGAGAFQIQNSIRFEGSTLRLRGNSSGLVTLTGALSEMNSGSKWLAVAKTESSAFALTGTNLYTHGTTVSGGLLLANNTSGSATGTGSVTVSSTGALGGTGTVSGNITLSNTAKLTGGGLTTAGKLNAGGSITLVSGTTLHVDVGGNAGTIGIAGTHFDQINLTNASSGTFNAGGANLTVGIMPNVVLNQAYTIVQTAHSNGVGASNGSPYTSFAGLGENTVYDTGVGVKYKLNYFTNRIDLTFTAIPEPASGIVMLCGALGLMKRRRAAKPV